LSDEDEQRVLRTAVRVTRPGGDVRVRSGTGGSLASRFATWFPDGAFGKKRVRVDESSIDDLLVLRVLE
jgi:hypothetical protein